MKIWVDADEFWPWYNLFAAPTSMTTELEVPAETVARWRKAIEDACAAQDEIGKLADSA